MAEKVERVRELPPCFLVRKGKSEPCGRCRRLTPFLSLTWQEEPGRWCCPECADKFDDLEEAE